MGTRPAKLAIRGRHSGKTKNCPACKNPKMQVVKFVRHSRPSGMFWVCDKCSNEMPTR